MNSLVIGVGVRVYGSVVTMTEAIGVAHPFDKGFVKGAFVIDVFIARGFCNESYVSL